MPKKRLNITIDDEIKCMLDNISKANHVSKSATITGLILKESQKSKYQKNSTNDTTDTTKTTKFNISDLFMPLNEDDTNKDTSTQEIPDQTTVDNQTATNNDTFDDYYDPDDDYDDELMIEIEDD